MRYIRPVVFSILLLRLCGYREALGHEPITQGYLQAIANKISDTIGVRHVPVALESVNAAQAKYWGKTPVIVCNPHYLQGLERDSATEWSLWWVMAHEVAHHARQHTLKQSHNHLADEWEAEYVAGHILGRLGATLAQAQAGTRISGDGIGDYRRWASPCQHFTLHAYYRTYANGQIVVEYQSVQSHVWDYSFEPVQTHPPQKERLRAIEIGWRAAQRP